MLTEELILQNSDLKGLFPTPILHITRPTPFEKIEYDHIKDIDVRTGPNNSVSDQYKVLDHKELTELKLFCKKSLATYTKHVYLASDDELDITISWVNVLNPGRQHLTHKHKNAIVSGVYYFESTEDCPITFISPLDSHLNYDFSLRQGNNHFNSEEWSIPSPGNSLVIFPAWLNHRVPYNETSKPRYSVAWNAFFKKGKQYGFPDVKTYVDLT